MAVRIVIVDDDMDDIILMNEIFATTEFAHVIRFFSNPEGVIPSLDLTPATGLPSLIVTDLNMPKLSGMELLTELKRNHRYNQIPVVVLTTSNSEREKQKVLKAGAKDFITKPIERKGYYQMIERIKNLLQETGQ
jgi:CheY-like chemotaxis protein